MRTKKAVSRDSLSLSAPQVSAVPSSAEELFRSAYPQLLRHAVIASAGDIHEAEDAVSVALVEICTRWDKIDNPSAYARQVIIRSLFKNKQRGLQRIRDRQIERADFPRPAQDACLTVWEEREWVMQLLKSLPLAQREVLACIIDEASTAEIAELLGKTDAAVRQSLHAARNRCKQYLAQRGGPMTGNDPIPASPDSQVTLGDLFGDFLDLAEQVVSLVSEDEIEERIQRILRSAGCLGPEMPRHGAEGELLWRPKTQGG